MYTYALLKEFLVHSSSTFEWTYQHPGTATKAHFLRAHATNIEEYCVQKIGHIHRQCSTKGWSGSGDYFYSIPLCDDTLYIIGIQSYAFWENHSVENCGDKGTSVLERKKNPTTSSSSVIYKFICPFMCLEIFSRYSKCSFFPVFEWEGKMPSIHPEYVHSFSSRLPLDKAPLWNNIERDT